MAPPSSDRVPRWHLAALAVCCVGAAAHQLGWLSTWIIDDAAISFAYARNLAQGLGPVPFAGGEWVEGYSNPTWVALLAVAEALGVDAFPASQVLCVALGALAVPLAWEVARRALPTPNHPGALVAAAAVAWNSQHAIWGASRLENALFTALLLGGVALLVREERAERPGFPWSAAVFAALSLTRPEGPMYGAIAAAWATVGHLRRRDGRRLALWLATLAVPVGIALAARYAVFAWPFPNTYYAKLGTTGSRPLDWNGRGWAQLRAFTAELGWSVLVPVLLVGGAARVARARVALYAALAATAAALLLWPGPDAFRQALGITASSGPAWWPTARVALLVLAGFGLPLASIGAPGGTARGLALHFGAAGVLFAVVSDGDWMDGYRWMSLLAGPAAVLLAAGASDLGAGIDRFVDRAPDAARAGLGSALLLPLLGLGPAWRQVSYTADYSGSPEDYPEMVKRRVDHFHALRDRLLLDDVSALDMDMGGTLWWGGYPVVDLAGLVDVPIAHHGYDQRPFWREYLFQETRPTFAHLHRAWESKTRLTAYPEWKAQYVQVEGYHEGRGTHDGIWLRRDVVLRDAWTPERPTPVEYGDGWALLGLDLPAPEVAAGSRVFVELGVRVGTSGKGRHPVLRYALACGDVVAQGRAELAGGVVSMEAAHTGEIAVGRYGWDIPATAPGACDVRLALVADGGVGWPTVGALPDGVLPAGDTPLVDATEIVFPGAVTVVSLEARDQLVAKDLGEVHAAAATGDCPAAERAWDRARRRAPASDLLGREGDARRALASCHALAASADGADLAAALPDSPAVTALAAARTWDRDAPAFLAARDRAVPGLRARADAARAASDWEAAYAGYAAVLRLDPTDAWARRYAEEARDHRLGLTR